MSVVCEDVRYKYHIIVCILLKFFEQMYTSNSTSHSVSTLLLLSFFFFLNHFVSLFIKEVAEVILNSVFWILTKQNLQIYLGYMSYICI